MLSVAEIVCVDFGAATDEDHRREGAVEVTSYELFSGQKPIDGGVYDARMGTTDHHYTCITCGHQRKNCPGHPGTLTLRTCLLSPNTQNEVRRWLRVVCLNCGAPMVDLSRRLRFAEAASLGTEGRRCEVCGVVHPKIVKHKEDNFTFLAESTGQGGAVKSTVLRPNAIREIFQRVTAETVLALGRETQPADYVISCMQVPPITIRPGVRIGVGAGPQSYHDLNNMIQHLVKRNWLLPDPPPPPEAAVSNDLDRMYQNMQQLYYDLILGSAAAQGAGKRGIVAGSRPSPAILRRIPRKEGRIRRNILGLRVFNISRAVISGNNHLAIDEVGIPLDFARTVQIAETVQGYNINRLMRFFLNGRQQYPGATRVVKHRTGAVHNVEGLKRNFQLEIGDVLFRDIVTGDICFLNRQPSLERSSIGVHVIVVLENTKNGTIQITVVACAQYGADFDGDQMNVMIPWSVMSRIEAMELSSVHNLFISTKNSSPVNGQVQDSVVGAYLLSRDRARGRANMLDKWHAMSLFNSVRDDPPSFAKVTQISARDALTLLLRRTPINYSRDSKWYSTVYEPFIHYSKKDVSVRVRRGRLVQGVLDKKSVGAGANGGLYHLIARDHGTAVAMRSIFSMQQIFVNYVGMAGFTVGISDMLLSPAGLREARGVVAEMLRDSELISQRLLLGKIVSPIGQTTRQFYERLQMNALKIPDRIMRPVLTSIDPETNGLFHMVATGSKGSNPNIIHIMAAVGQIELNTQRIQTHFSFGRTLAYFPRFAMEPQAYGFIPNSYISGLSAPEFVYGQMNGRHDLISKALATSQTGYANRKAVMGLQSCQVDYFRRVSFDKRIVVQPLYGEDGLDPRRVEYVRFRTVFASDDEMREQFLFDGRLDAAAEELERLVRDRDDYRRIFMRFESVNFNYQMSDMRLMPVNVGSIVENVRVEADEARTGRTATAPLDELLEMKRTVDGFCANLPYVFMNNIQRGRQSPIPPHLAAATHLMQMLLRTELCMKSLAGLTRGMLTGILDMVFLQYTQSLIDYGEAVGMLAAQAVSEPITQYMLDSHHRSVSGGTNRSGVVRPQEIFGAKPMEAEQSSEMLLFLRDPGADQARAQEVANSIELMTLARFVRQWDLLYETYLSPDEMYPPYAGDLDWMAEYQRLYPLLQPPPNITNWCLRLELDRTACILKGMSLEYLVGQLRRQHPAVFAVHAPENSSRVVMRVYLLAAVFRRGALRSAEEEKAATAYVQRLHETVLRGIPGIRTATVEKLSRSAVDGKGGVQRTPTYAIRTVGTNLYGAIMNPHIDPLRAVSSSIDDTCRQYGIEAARLKIVSEIHSVLGDNCPNNRHLLTYADIMTRTGGVSSLEKAGLMVREPSNVLLRMATAAPLQVLADATVERTHNPIYGMAAPMMVGMTPRVGTLYPDIVMDTDFIRRNTTSVNEMVDALKL